MKQIHTIEEAQNWFLSHSSGSVECVRRDGKRKVVDNYPDAEKFLGGKF